MRPAAFPAKNRVTRTYTVFETVLQISGTASNARGLEWLLRTLLLIYVGCVPAFLRVDGQTRSQVALICYFSNDESDIVTPIFLSVVIVATAVLQWYTEMQAEMMMEPPYVGLNLWLIAQNDCLINFFDAILNLKFPIFSAIFRKMAATSFCDSPATFLETCSNARRISLIRGFM